MGSYDRMTLSFLPNNPHGTVLRFLLSVSRSLRSPFNKHYYHARGLRGNGIWKSIPQEMALNGILKIQKLSVWPRLGQHEQT